MHCISNWWPNVHICHTAYKYMSITLAANTVYWIYMHSLLTMSLCEAEWMLLNLTSLELAGTVIFILAICIQQAINICKWLLQISRVAPLFIWKKKKIKEKTGDHKRWYSNTTYLLSTQNILCKMHYSSAVWVKIFKKFLKGPYNLYIQGCIIWSKIQ